MIISKYNIAFSLFVNFVFLWFIVICLFWNFIVHGYLVVHKLQTYRNFSDLVLYWGQSTNTCHHLYDLCNLQVLSIAHVDYTCIKNLPLEIWVDINLMNWYSIIQSSRTCHNSYVFMQNSRTCHHSFGFMQHTWTCHHSYGFIQHPWTCHHS